MTWKCLLPSVVLKHVLVCSVKKVMHVLYCTHVRRNANLCKMILSFLQESTFSCTRFLKSCYVYKTLFCILLDTFISFSGISQEKIGRFSLYEFSICVCLCNKQSQNIGKVYKKFFFRLSLIFMKKYESTGSTSNSLKLYFFFRELSRSPMFCHMLEKFYFLCQSLLKIFCQTTKQGIRINVL